LYSVLGNIRVSNTILAKIYKIFYFENNEWIEWDISENADKIYDFYVNTYLL